MRNSNDLAAILVASAKLEESGKLDRILAIFDDNNVLTAATTATRHRATAKSAGTVITRNPRQAVIDTTRVETTPTIVKPDATVKPARKTRSDKGVKRGPRKTTATITTAKPVKSADKPVQPSAKNWDGKLMLSGEGTASKGQREWLAKNGQDAEMCALISMVDASNYRALVDGRITVAQYNAL